MMIPCRKSRVVLVSICLIAVLLLMVRNMSSEGDKLVLAKDKVIGPALISQNEFFDSFAKIQECPVCFGQEACFEVSSKKGLEISRQAYTDNHQLPGVHQVYDGSNVKFWIFPLSSMILNQHAMKGFEAAVCRNASYIKKERKDLDRTKSRPCKLSEAVPNSFLYSLNVNKAAIMDLFQAHLVSRTRMPITNCVSHRLIDALVRAFDVNKDDTLNVDEKSVMLTSLATWPSVAVNLLMDSQNMAIPRVIFYGTCGRTTFIEAALKPLSAFMDQPLEVRKGLAVQLLKLIDSYINEDPNWMIFTSEITLPNLVVSSSGQLVLFDLSQTIFLDREIHTKIDEDPSSASTECDFKCMSKFFDDMLHSADDSLCYEAENKLDYMYALACRNVLSDMELERSLRPKKDQRGLLHSMINEDEVTEVNNLIRECIDETEPGGRRTAAMNLMELLGADFDTNNGHDDDSDSDMGGGGRGEGDDFGADVHGGYEAQLAHAVDNYDDHLDQMRRKGAKVNFSANETMLLKEAPKVLQTTRKSKKGPAVQPQIDQEPKPEKQHIFHPPPNVEIEQT